MCGIAGFAGPVPCKLSASLLLERMIRAIVHRGPDEQGQYAADGVGLGHARLSIIDLSSGQQPMSNEDGTIWVSFNGEIFNYVELAEQLTAKGHRYRTRSDTETIVHAYEQKGDACVEDFNGDFAFAVWDSKQRRLLLARDRMGVRPVYYTLRGQTLIFASEVKAILAVPGVSAELDPIALDQVFTFWFPLAPRTPFKGICELPPGHILTFEAGKVTVRPYWRLSYPDRHDYPAIGEAVATQQLHDMLVDATRIRLRADVPVGAYLSGGLDSSVTTALIRNFTDSHLRTFSVTFETTEFDESEYQQALVKALDTEHSSILCTTGNIAEMFPAVIRHTERPILRTAPAPLYRLASHVRANNFKVVMTGEGADEILAGYDIFKEARIRHFWARQPGSARRPKLLRQLYPYLVNLRGQPQPYLEAFFRAGLTDPANPFFSHLPRWGMTSRLKQLFSDDLRQAVNGYDAIAELHGQLPAEFGRWHPLSQAQFLEAGYLLPGYILSAQGDRVAMAHAVEGRFPFLDHRVVEFCNALPPRLKLRGLVEKHILRQAMRKHLPEMISKRPKQPYRAPDAACFFAADAPDYVCDLLSEHAVRQAGLFDAAGVARLVEKCRAGTATGFRDNMALVGVLSVQLLHSSLVGGESVVPSSRGKEKSVYGGSHRASCA
jgi:asparagine synthase (glutamine-hydrolysing)